MSCYTGFFKVRRGWQSLNTGPQFYLRIIRRTGWLWIYTSRSTDERPFKPNKLSVPFLYPRVPAGLASFRGLVPPGETWCLFYRRHTLWEGVEYEGVTMINSRCCLAHLVNGIVVIVWWLDLQLTVQSVPIATKVASSNPVYGKCTRYNIMGYRLSVTCDRSVIFSGYSGFIHQ